MYYRWISVNPDFDKMTIAFSLDNCQTWELITPSTTVQKVKLSVIDTKTKLIIDNYHWLFGITKNKKLADLK